jgi:hypothetical protein
MPEAENKMIHTDLELNDKKFRLMGIPSFGIIIPNVAGLFGDLQASQWVYWFGYIYFIALAALIWQGNRYLLFRTRKRFTWFDRPIEKLILLLMNNVFYTAPLTIAWLCLWYLFAVFPKTNWDVIQLVVLINVICVLFVTHVYETVFLVKEKVSETVKIEQLQRAKAEAELAVLKNQIDPHFMFNSLNTLSYLISSDKHKASQFTENLAEVYRYILLQKDQTLVLLEDELEFTHKYTELLYLRFGKALIIKKRFNGTAEKDYLIPPTSVFVAFENAVKHNEISERMPLYMDVDVSEGRLQIINVVQERKNRHHSSKIGLKNLDERFRIVTGKGISANKENGKFIVSMPLVPLNAIT